VEENTLAGGRGRCERSRNSPAAASILPVTDPCAIEMISCTARWRKAGVSLAA
jgi:hypothetical protein